MVISYFTQNNTHLINYKYKILTILLKTYFIVFFIKMEPLLTINCVQMYNYVLFNLKMLCIFLPLF